MNRINDIVTREIKRFFGQIDTYYVKRDDFVKGRELYDSVARKLQCNEVRGLVLPRLRESRCMV